MRASLILFVLAIAPGFAIADDPPAALSTEQLADKVRESVVVISFTGRTGQQEGLGSGFVISPDGLIATNLHVIGEARPIMVRTADGKEFSVTEIHATERSSDLAVIRVDVGNEKLTALDLGDSDRLRQGQVVAAVGNPQGLAHSVVAGVVSGRREIDGRSMIQLAMPIERGNSGGPLLDMQGQVQGILTLKSIVTENLGFALEINALKPLLESPNPVPIDRWLTIGVLDADKWDTVFGGRWRQRAGRIQVEGAGEGFGGRSVALSKTAPPAVPYELAVSVKLDDESGAAGLVFHADGQDRHYGFYPSGGKLRLTRFDGPVVFAWHILAEVASPHYRPGEWNRLKVRLEEGHIQCFVNDEPVVESRDAELASGRIGLAKFRETRAEFKNFEYGGSLPGSTLASESVARILESIADLPLHRPADQAFVEKLLPDADSAGLVLREEARELEQRAARLRTLAVSVHQKNVRDQLKAEVDKQDGADLLRAALLIARLDNDEVDVDAYLREADHMGEEIRRGIADGAGDADRLSALNQYLFERLGFHGSRTDYYNRSNSYLNEVIDDREGLPITLAVLYIEIGRRVGLNIVGVGLPGHFVVRHEPKEGEAQLIDVFERGATMSREQAGLVATGAVDRPLEDADLAAMSKREIITRMLRNLAGVARESMQVEDMLSYAETITAINPDSGPDRFMRAVLRFQTGRTDEAMLDTEELLKQRPQDVDLQQIQQLQRAIEESAR